GPDSIKAAMMAEIMWNQSPKAFAEFHEALYEHQKVESDIWATEKYMLEIIEKYVPSGDAKKAKKSIRALEGLFEVKEDFKITTANGVSGTPTVFVNGVKTSTEALSETVNNELALKEKSTK
ncbi:MAG: thioredoxin domain-containing protein, partial [Gorillibacterium sp.]|nr:thioredoxin domain-containing protein [Gorillibacterium sp.]